MTTLSSVPVPQDVVATRLSEDPAVQVALIESGPTDDASEVHTPVAFPQLFKSVHDWDYSSEPEPALLGRRIYLPRGKVLGGCSSMKQPQVLICTRT
jgi:choline dehydrogenase